MPCLANVYGGHTCVGLAKGYAENIKYARGPRIQARPHLDYWSPFQCLPGTLVPTLWTGSLGFPLVVPWGITLYLQP